MRTRGPNHGRRPSPPQTGGADCLDSAADLLRVKWGASLRGGVMIANPVAAANEIPASEMANHIAAAVSEARRAGITGKAVPLHILARLVEMTRGRSLRTNIAPAESNARLAAEIAVALSET